MMRIPYEIVGATMGPLTETVEAEWLAAYAAALQWKPGSPEPHPLFPVCYEWPALVAIRAKTIPDEISPRGVHATHDLIIHRLPRPGDRLWITAKITRVEARSPGAYVVTRLETVDREGAPVTTTENGTLYLGIGVTGAHPAGATRASDADHTEREHPEGATPPWEARVPIAGDLAHVYSEASRIWNSIHTERVAAVAAGLPDVILHGTATLALAVSKILEHESEAPARVGRIACRFSGMVFMPSTLIVRGSCQGSHCSFEALTEDGRSAVDRGILTFAARETR
ncbi:MAG: MaoC family dehydratase N-terminal domain-containing protein [Candidatus Rokubacteria bacterium]|nr:MaoC family dehydratase N-terminal domain-containing protein [Candidatus Rokubacteria bacterium]